MIGIAACKRSDKDDAEAENDDASDLAARCDGDCALLLQSPCTCGSDDPCGWADDGFCDRSCLFQGIVSAMFDDSADCPGPCEGACKGGFYTVCTCDVDDPCAWSEDASCDVACVENGVVDEMFDDDVDCTKDTGS